MAQDNSQEDELSCDPNDLVFDQAELHDSLKEFGPELEADSEAALEKLYTVGQQYQEMALECGYIPENAGELTVGEDIDRIMRTLETINGDPINGQLLYNDGAPGADGNTLGCIGCHMDEGSTGPPTTGTWSRWDEQHSQLDQFEDYTFDRYIVESIVEPNAYIVPDYQNVMPSNFSDRLTYQQMADIIAYLRGQDQLLDE